MLLQYRLKTTLHLRAAGNLFERTHSKVANDLLNESVVRISFDNLHQLQRRLFQLHTLRGRLIKRAVNHVRPMDQRPEWLGIKAKLFVSDVGDQLSARLSRRI